MSAAYDHQESGLATSDEERFVPPLPRVSIQCFCDTREVQAALNDAAADRRANRAHVTVQPGGIQAARNFFNSAPTPNVIVVESAAQPDALLLELDALAEVCDPATKVIVIGHTNDIQLYRQLIERGVADYLVAPFASLDFLAAAARLYNGDKAVKLGRTIAFIGARGGSGSSTIAHNVAWAVSQELQQDVIIADLDLPFGTSGLNFNQDPVQGIADALYAGERLDETFVDRLTAKCTERLSLMASPGTLEREYDIETTPVEQLLSLVRKAAPCTVLDLPHVWTRWSRQSLITADDIIITATPDLTSLRNTKNMVDHFRANRSNDRPPLLVLNQVGMPKRPEIGMKDFGESVGAKVVAKIAFDPQLFGSAANNGQMVAEIEADAKAIETFSLLAEVVMGKREGKTRKRSPFDALFGLLGRKDQ